MSQKNPTLTDSSRSTNQGNLPPENNMSIAGRISGPIAYPITRIPAALLGGAGAEPTTNATVGGAPISQLTATTGVTGDAGGRMFVMDGLPIQASGVLSEVKLFADTGMTSCKISIWRSGSKVWQSDTVALVANSVNTIPVTEEVQVDDLLGVWLPAGKQIKCIACTSVNLKYGADVSGSVSSVSGLSTLSNVAMLVEAIAVKPMLAIVGDSIGAGTNTATGWVPPFAGGTKGGNILAQPGYVGAKNKNWGYRNYALGSTTFAWVAATGLPAAISAGATHIWIHCGVNDVATSRTWAAVEADLDTIRAAKPSAVRLYISEILPWTAGTDGNAATIRTWNDNLATWCSANGVTLIACHDPMGQIRGSTGELDNLLTAYNQDNVHITQAGVYKLAYIFAPIAPVFSSSPSISGVPGVDVTVNVTPGTASSEPTYTYQWKADGVAIPGATSSSYTITKDELGTDITVTQTATNSAGSVAATSAAIGPVVTYPFTVDFDGINDYTTGSPSNVYTGAFAIEVNIDADAFSNYVCSVNTSQLFISFIGTGGDIVFGNTSGWGEWAKSNGLWRFVHDMSLSGFARLRAFKDGVEQTKARTTASYVQFNPATVPTIFGARATTTNFFNGRLSAIKIWGRACLPSDSDQTSNLVLSLGPVSGTTWYDTSGNNKNYTLTGGAAGV